MSVLENLVPRNLAARRARTLLTMLGIALGVATVVATGVTQDSATRAVAEMFDQAAGRADLAVTNAVAGIVGGEGFDVATLERVRAAEGVEAAAPLLQVTTLPTAQLSDWKMSFIFGNFDGALVYGVDPQASGSMGHYRVVDGEDLPPGTQDAILLAGRYADELGLHLGDQITLAAPSGQVRFTVTGLLASDGLARLNRGQVAVTTLAAAQRHFGRPDRVDQIDVVTAAGTDTNDVQGHLQATLGEEFRVFRPANKGTLVDQMIQAIAVGLGFISVLGLVVGGFLIYNTFATTVAERTRELGLLRVLGAGRVQIIGLVLAEAALVGLVGASLGVPLGLTLASGMTKVAGATVNTELTGLTVLPQHVILGLATGLVLSLLAGLAPALRAGRVTVVEAIQQHRRVDGKVSRRSVGLGLILTLPALATVVVFSIRLVDVSFELAFLVLVMVLVGVGLLIPAIIPLLERRVGAALGLLGVEGWLGGRNLARNPGRAALTAGALMFGLASAIVIGAEAASAQGLSQDYMDRTLDADLWVYAPQQLPFSLAAEFEALPEIQLARPATNLTVRFIPPDATQSETALLFTAIDLQRSAKLDLFFAADGGSQEQAIKQLATGGAVMIPTALREWYGLDVGDTIRLQTLRGPVDFRIAGVTLNLTASGYTVTGAWNDAMRYFGVDRVSIFGLHLAPGTDAETARQLILDRWGENHNLCIETFDDFRARTQQLSDSYFAISNAAVLVGLVVAALGVINTLLINVLERRREIGMLRSLGMTHGQVLRLILSESVAMGLLGGILGLGLGAWLSRYAVATSSSLSGYDFPYVFPLQAFVVCLLIALAVPPLAGLWPAWRGARTNVIEAVRSE